MYQLIASFVAGVFLGWAAHRIDERARQIEPSLRVKNNGNNPRLSMLKDVIRCPACGKSYRDTDGAYVQDWGRCFACESKVSLINRTTDAS